MCCVVPEFRRLKKWKKKNTNCKNSQRTRRIEVKVIKEEQTAGTLKLTVIASRRMRAQDGDDDGRSFGGLKNAQLLVRVAVGERMPKVEV
jgi:hypothetical protein